MTAEIILPNADQIIDPVVDKIIEKRPNAAPYLNGRTGVYWHPVLGFRGQAARMLQRLSLMVQERRLKTATGQALLDYVASEFDPVPETGSTTAVGAVTLGYGTDTTYPGGVFPKGTRITRNAATVLGVVYPSADYETLIDATIENTSTSTVTIPVKAVRQGPDANHPLLSNWSAAPDITVPKLVANVIATAFEAGGGSNGADDAYVRRFAKADSLGQFGPTYAESLLAGLSAAGVRRVLQYDVAETGTSQILVADASWGSSQRWADVVRQRTYDEDLVGFGCRVAVGLVRNRAIRVQASVALRDGTYLSDTVEIDAAIQKAVTTYFDDRVDWNVWNEASLKAAITRAHVKVYSCLSVVVKDFSTGATMSEVVTPDYSEDQFHYLVPSNAVKVNYTGPQ